jgi:Cu(I)/Ag(I) efflux system membrane protein CusA/SilA
MQRIAVPMIGGMVTSTILTLIVIPVLFALVRGPELRRAPRHMSGRRASPQPV